MSFFKFFVYLSLIQILLCNDINDAVKSSYKRSYHVIGDHNIWTCSGQTYNDVSNILGQFYTGLTLATNDLSGNNTFWNYFGKWGQKFMMDDFEFAIPGSLIYFGSKKEFFDYTNSIWKHIFVKWRHVQGNVALKCYDERAYIEAYFTLQYSFQSDPLYESRLTEMDVVQVGFIWNVNPKQLHGSWKIAFIEHVDYYDLNDQDKHQQPIMPFTNTI